VQDDGVAGEHRPPVHHHSSITLGHRQKNHTDNAIVFFLEKDHRKKIKQRLTKVCGSGSIGVL
jgi:hypothetical protein